MTVPNFFPFANFLSRPFCFLAHLFAILINFANHYFNFFVGEVNYCDFLIVNGGDGGGGVVVVLFLFFSYSLFLYKLFKIK